MTKKQLLEAEETLAVDYGGHYTAYASRNPLDFDGESVIGGDWNISYHDGEMPAFNAENLATVDELLAKMKTVAPLTKWSIVQPE